MSKIAIILGSNIHWAPYYYRYENVLIENNIQFDLILWNRENIKEISKGKLIQYSEKDETDNKDPKKILKFWKWSKFVKKTIKHNAYERLIFLGTHAYAPAFLSFFLKRNYKGKYWLDIRDKVYEDYKLFYELGKVAIENAYATSISSPGYERFLPHHDYFYMHNIDANMNKIVDCFMKTDSDQIRISFIGNVRYYEENIKLITQLANDKRFVLQYFGAGSEKLEQYCKEHNIVNTRFHGRFHPSETVNFYNETDIVNNVYGNNKVGLQTALSNKLYYAVRLRLPLLVCTNTYMSKLCDEYGIGFSFFEDETFADNLYDWYCDFGNKSKTVFDKVWGWISAQDNEAMGKLNSFINAGK